MIVAHDRSFDEILRDSSSDADLVLLGMAAPDTLPGGYVDYEQYFVQLDRRAKSLRSTVFVLAAEEIAFREVLLREGDEG